MIQLHYRHICFTPPPLIIETPPTLTTFLPGRRPPPTAPIYFSSTIDATRRLPAPATGRLRTIPPAIAAEPHSLNDIFVIPQPAPARPGRLPVERQIA